MSEKLVALKSRVGRVGVLRRAWHKVSGAACVLLALGGIYALYSAVDIALKLSMPARVASFALVALAVGWTARRMLIKPLLTRARAEEVASEIERGYPEVEEALSTSIEYGTDRAKAESLSSPALVDALVDDTHQRTEGLRFEETVDWRRPRRLATAAALAAVVIVACMSAWPHLFVRTFLRLLNPVARIDPPTFTVIEDVTPKSVEVARGQSVSIGVKLGGSVPESASVTLMTGSGSPENRAERVESMARGRSAREFVFELKGVTEDVQYVVAAGDATSGPHSIHVYEEPRVLDIALRLEFPEYTGLPPKEVTDGLGEISALRGTRVTVTARLNKPVSSGSLALGSGRIPGAPSAKEGGKDPILSASFTVEKDDSYSVHVLDEKGRANPDPVSYRVTALSDRPPRVRIVKPDREVMSFRNQPVKIEIEADDDYGVKEIGICHTLGDEEKPLVIKKFGGPGQKDAAEKYELQLALKGFKGGEIIQYYAYARDNDTMGGPKEALGELHFLRTYDEEDYAPGPMQGRMKRPEAAKKIEELIRRQMDLLKKTFETAKEKAAADELAGKAKGFSQDQSGIKGDLDALLADIDENMKSLPAQPGEAPMELDELRKASGKMGEAVERLGATAVKDAAKSEAESLRHLSEAERLILSEFADPSVQQAMSQAARKSRQNRRKREQQQTDEMEKEMAQLPPILEREDEIERELDKLDDEPEENLTPEQKDQRAEQARKLAEEQKSLASKAEQSSKRMDSMSSRQQQQSGSQAMQQASKAMQQAASAMKSSAQAAEQSRTEDAARGAAEASRELDRAQREMDRAAERSLADRIDRAKSDAERIAKSEEDLAGESAATAEAKKKADEAGAEGAEARRKAEEAAKDLKGAQEGLADEARSLAEEIGHLAESASGEAADVKLPLNRANARAASGAASGKMDSSRQALAEGNPSKASGEAADAARELNAIAGDLRDALEASRMKDAQKLAAAIAKAREMVDKERTLAEAASAGRADEEMGAEQKSLGDQAHELAETAPDIPAVRESGKDADVRGAFERSGERMGATSKALAAKDATEAAREASQAAAEAEKGLRALEAASAKDLETELAKLLETAREGLRRQEKVDGTVANSAERAKTPRPVAEAEARAAASEERLASERTGELEDSLGAAARRIEKARPSDQTAAEMEALRERLSRGDVPERMDALAKELEAKPQSLAKEPEARKLTDEEQALLREIAAATRRLESLLADAGNEELRRLRTAEADAREAASALKELDQQVKAMSKGAPGQEGQDPQAAGKEPKVGGEGQEPSSRGARQLSEGLEEDLAYLERRLGELGLGEQDAKRAKDAREVAKEVTRSLSRNQLPRPSNRLAEASGDLQVVGDSLMRRIEEVLKKRKITEPADENAPEEYRGLVEKYYRVLSEESEE